MEKNPFFEIKAQVFEIKKDIHDKKSDDRL